MSLNIKMKDTNNEKINYYHVINIIQYQQKQFKKYTNEKDRGKKVIHLRDNNSNRINLYL